MRILHVADFYWPYVGGVEQHVRSLSHALAERGHDVTVATLLADPSLAATENDGPVSVVRLRSSAQRWGARHLDPRRPWAPPLPDPALTRSLARLARRRRFEVIHGHDWMARSAWLAAMRTGAPLVLTEHYFTRACAKKSLMRSGQVCPGPSLSRCLPCAGAHYGPLSGPLVFLGNTVGALVDDHVARGRVAVSRSTAELNGLGRRRPPEFEVVPNLLPGSPPPTSAHPSAVPSGPFVLYVGDVRAEKGAAVLFDTYRGADDLPTLVVVGKRSGSEVPVPPGVVHVGPLDNAAVRSLMARASVTVIPSVWPEPFSIVAIESLAAGTPVIASRVGGLADIVEDGIVGRVVPPGDAAALGDAIRELSGDADLRHRMGRAAVDVAQRYRADRVVIEIERVYERLVHAT